MSEYDPLEDHIQNTDVTPDEKIWAAVSYLSFVCVITLLIKKESTYCQFHAKQALVLAILIMVFRSLYFISSLFIILGSLEMIAIIVLGAMAFGGRWTKIPGIYELSKKIQF